MIPVLLYIIYILFISILFSSEEELINKNLNTTLTAQFQLNQTDMEARQYLYPDIHNFYVFNENTKTCAMRKKNRKPVFIYLFIYLFLFIYYQSKVK